MDVLQSQISNLIAIVSRVVDDPSRPSYDVVDALLVHCQRVRRMISLLVDIVPNMDRNLPLIENVSRWLTEITATLATANNSSNFSVTHSFTGERGRPRIVISQAMLEYLIGNRFSVRQISLMLGTSVSTVRRRMNDIEITVRSTYTIINDDELDALVTQIQHQHPNCGYRLMRGYLTALGYRIQETRIRDSLSRIDPLGTVSRWIQGIRRRTYSVSGPNALWHIDGNHKLIRWKLVIHAAIDGYSRLPVYCYCSNNNLASTVLSLFIQSVEEFGLPSRVRCDMGGENSLVGYYMLSHPNRGPGRGSIIAGRSIHNQRIERFWRDLFTGCTTLFYHLFYQLEDVGLLDSNNRLHLWCLHFIYIPYINHTISSFVNGWSHHPMSSERGLSPLQLWMQGMLNNYSSGNRVSEEVYQSDNYVHYGVDWNQAFPDSDDCEQVDVPVIDPPTEIDTDEDFQQLRQQYSLNRLLSSDCHAVDMYTNLLDSLTLRQTQP